MTRPSLSPLIDPRERELSPPARRWPGPFWGTVIEVAALLMLCATVYLALVEF